MEERLLITAEQVRKIAAEKGLIAGVVEKDYALSWLLKEIYGTGGLKDSFVLKGGTAIRKVYFPQTWRFSEDLDFTVIGDKNSESIRERMQKAFESLREECGIDYSFDSFHPTEGSIVANVQFLGPLNFRNRIKHDITLKEKMVLEPERRSVDTGYPDLPAFGVIVYSLTEILVEKIRSIMQRGYSRDYYDVWKLVREDRFKEREVKSLLVRKCELNEVKYQPELLFEKDRLDAVRSFWTQGLAHLTRELPDFEAVVSELRQRLSFLQ